MKRFQYFSHITFILTVLVTALVTLSSSNYPYTSYVHIDISARDLLTIQFGYMLTLGSCFPGIVECILDLANSTHHVEFLFLYERIEIIFSALIPAVGFIIASFAIENDPQYFGMVVFILLIVQRNMMLPPLLNLLISTKSKIWSVSFGYVNCAVFFLSDAFALLAYSGSPYRIVFLTIHWTLFFAWLVHASFHGMKYVRYLHSKVDWDKLWAEEEPVILSVIILLISLLQRLLTFAIFPTAVEPAHYQAYNLTMLGATSLVTAVSVTILTTRLTRTRLTNKIEEHNTFVRYVGHEVRTPLNISSVCTTLMEDMVNDEAIPEAKRVEILQLLEQQKSAFGLAVNILNDLIDFEKMEKAELALDCSRQNPVDFVLSCTPMFEVQSNEKSITLTAPSVADREAFRELEVHIDTYKLGKCLRNFISNAYKFTPVGGSIVISVTKVEEIVPPVSRAGSFKFVLDSSSIAEVENKGTTMTYVRIAVADSGAGISEENLPKLFNEVVQFDPNRLQEGKGSGLGLYMAKGIADLHKIRLHASSPGLGKGTTIAMDIPVVPPDASSIRRLVRRVSSGFSDRMSKRMHSTRITNRVAPMPDSAPEYTAITVLDSKKTETTVGISPRTLPIVKDAFNLTGRRILVVDDSIPSAKVLAMLFGRMGASVDTAADGQQAIDKVASCIESGASIHSYYFILMDYNMPVMIGPDACRAIRALGYTHPIFGLTGNASREERARFEGSGVDSVFIKPLDVSEFKLVASRIFTSKETEETNKNYIE